MGPGHVVTGIGSWIERRARTQPDRVAMISGDRSTTYAEMASRIRRLAHGLRSLGVRRGDRVGWAGPNHPAFLESLFASASLGAALAPANHRQEPSRIATQLADAAPTVVVTNGIELQGLLPDGVAGVIGVDRVQGATVELEALIADARDAPIGEAVGPDEVCFIPYTSGTTGSSKGVMLTHANVTWNVINFLSCADFRGDDVTLAIAPFFRSGGTGVNVLPVLFMGGTVVVPESMDADEILRLAERHRATIGFANPDLLDALMASSVWSGVDLSSVRFILTGGAPVPDRLVRAYLQRGLALVQGYGLSEAAPLALLLDAETAVHKVGAAGKPPLFVDIRILGPGGDVEPGETGELLVRGPNVMAGYWNRPEATRAAIDADGWLHTGDAARMDDDGDVWIVDRCSAGFRTGKRIVYPGDIERVILEHPDVADVGAVGVRGPDGDREAVAFVVLRDGVTMTAEAILAFAAERLPPESVPRSLAFVDRLPRSSVGKLLRGELEALISVV
jgi:acyl-CoA synthetase (AMP-forming)/AMP-acid ligase II